MVNMSKEQNVRTRRPRGTLHVTRDANGFWYMRGKVAGVAVRRSTGVRDHDAALRIARGAEADLIATRVASLPQVEPIASESAHVSPPVLAVEAIYCVGEVGSTYVKVGRAASVRDRLRNLQISNPRKLVLRFNIPGSAAEETRLHGLFADRRVRGEWFDDADGVIASWFTERTRLNGGIGTRNAD